MLATVLSRDAVDYSAALAGRRAELRLGSSAAPGFAVSLPVELVRGWLRQAVPHDWDVALMPAVFDSKRSWQLATRFAQVLSLPGEAALVLVLREEALRELRAAVEPAVGEWPLAATLALPSGTEG